MDIYLIKIIKISMNTTLMRWTKPLMVEYKIFSQVFEKSTRVNPKIIFFKKRFV